MKNAKEIITSIQNKPQYSKLSNHKCIKKIQSMFIPPVQQMINFSYIKNEILFFVFNHPVGKQEFDNNIQSIKSALNFHKSEECSKTLFKDIRAFVTHTPKKQLKIVKQKYSYKERASGNFKTDVKDNNLKKIILSIQKTIKERNLKTSNNDT